MLERLTWEEITERHPEEWAVVIEIDDDPSEAEIRSARVHFHSTDRDEAEAAALRLPVPRHLGVFFTGKLVDPRPCPDVMKFRYSAVHHLVVVRAEVRGPGGIRTGYLAVDTGAIYTMVRPRSLPPSERMNPRIS